MQLLGCANLCAIIFVEVKCREALDFVGGMVTMTLNGSGLGDGRIIRERQPNTEADQRTKVQNIFYCLEMLVTWKLLVNNKLKLMAYSSPNITQTPPMFTFSQ